MVVSAKNNQSDSSLVKKQPDQWTWTDHEGNFRQALTEKKEPLRTGRRNMVKGAAENSGVSPFEFREYKQIL